MVILGKYHARDIHSWVDSDDEECECDFHPLRLCSCGKCGQKASDNDESSEESSENEEDDDEEDEEEKEENVEDEEEQKEDKEEGDDSDSERESNNGEPETDDQQISCDGKEYQTRSALTCPLHALLYEIECDRMGVKAKQVIDTDMGIGHSNQPESKFNVLTQFRPKDTNLHQLHYEFSTNCGLCQASMTDLIKKHGPTYHLIRELYAAMGLPEIEEIEQQWKKDTEGGQS